MTSTTGFARTHVMPAIFCAALLSSAGDAAGLMPWKSGPDTREAVSQIVEANIIQVGSFPNRSPDLGNIYERLPFLTARKHMGIS